MKEQIIMDYLSKIDFNKDWGVSLMKEDIYNLIGSKPAIDVKYKKDVFINENSGEAIEYMEVDSISIVFFDDTDSPKKITIKPGI